MLNEKKELQSKKITLLNLVTRKYISIIMVFVLALSMSACANKTESAATVTVSEINSEGWPEGQEEGFIPVDGGRVLYHYYGKDKPDIPIIFLHGGPGGTSDVFFAQIALSDSHPIVLYNQLGNAGSDFAENIESADDAKKYCTIEHYVDELQTVIDYFSFKEFMLVGHSWGTMLAVEYAAAKQPEGLKGLVLAGPFLNVDTWCEDAQRLIKSLPKSDICGKQMDGNEMWEVILECEENGSYYDDERYSAINGIYLENFNYKLKNIDAFDNMPSDYNVTQHWVEDFDVYNYMWGPSEFSCNGTLKGHDSTGLLSEISVPILYVCGQDDSGTYEAARKYNALTSEGEICVLPGCAHCSLCERPDEFNAVVKAFIDRIK